MSPVQTRVRISAARLFVAFFVATLLTSVVGIAGHPSPAAASGPPHTASGFEYVKTFAPQPAQCAYNGGFFSNFYVRGDCIRVTFDLSGTETGSHTAKVQFRSANGATLFKEVTASHSSGGTGWFAVSPIDSPAPAWAAGKIVTRVIADGANAGEGSFYFNALGATVTPGPLAANDRYQPGEDVPLTGTIAELNDLAASTQQTGVAAAFKIRVVNARGQQLYLSPVQTAQADGTLPAGLKIPGSATAGVTSSAAEGYQATLGIDVVQASFTDSGLTTEVPPRAKGTFGGDPAGSGAVTLQVPPTTLLIDNTYPSSLGWVKPGQTYPFRVTVTNYMLAAKAGTVVNIPAPPSVTFTTAHPLAGGGTAQILNSGHTVKWTIGTMGAASGLNAKVVTLIVQARASTLAQDPEVVWKDLSSTATLTYTGGPAAGIKSSTHGPKVIPPGGGYETARYGDKPFVIVPVDFRDRKHGAGHNGDTLLRTINAPDKPGSTYNLYQEMSFKQLYVQGGVPSAEIASAGFDYAPGFNFTKRDPTKATCRGTTFGDLPASTQDTVEGTPAYPERISDGWYQLPGDTEYYGGDYPAFTLGTGSTIDGACGSTSKSVYDAAVIADPETDYNQYDTDKDGVVDFFMMVFAGLGGNGDSQLNGVPPYDNIWPHSSSLEYSYTDSTTGLKGYISHDQLTSQTGVPQCYVGNGYTTFADCAANGGTGNNAHPVYVRVGPYNVNPESAIDHASVIAHEYGHHLGLPDFYSNDYTTYNDWMLMASDYSQHMTIFGKQELGWVVPEYLQPGETRNVTNWNEIKNDTGQIKWKTPGGTPYVLSAANGDQNVHNGQAFGVKLPHTLLINPATIAAGASLPNVWYSGRGDDFGCNPVGGHNLDIALPELANVAAGTPITVTYKSSWDIEWDYDYGFTLVSTDGKNYTSLPSAKGYTTAKANNPNGSACLDQIDNGLTGTSGSYRDGTQTLDRNPAVPTYKDPPFLQDQYDLTAYAGQKNVVLRLSYYTDPGTDRFGWMMDDFVVKAGNTVLYQSNFTNDEPLRTFPGGCGDNGIHTAQSCTDGWSLIDAQSGSPNDHGYFLELRDRSGFDASSRGQSDRGAIGWAPGVLVEYTDEARGYGNIGASPPRQHYIDSQPQPGLDCGEALTDDPTTPRDDTAKWCDDAAFTAAAGDRHFDDDPATTGASSGEPGDWIDNFSDPASDDGFWHFAYNCLSVDVTSLSGTDVAEALPSNLRANAVIKALPGCIPFSYTGAYGNQAPTADAQVKQLPGTLYKYQFDGSGSTDDLTPSSQLKYEWDFDNNGTYDATGQVVIHQYPTTGPRTARLRVTDKSSPAKSSTDTVSFTVTPLPDLTITQHKTSAATVKKGNNVTFTATIANKGAGNAGPSQTEWYLYGGINGMNSQVLGQVATPAIASGTSRQVILTINTGFMNPGQYRIRVYTDRRQQVQETTPNNNAYYFYLTITN